MIQNNHFLEWSVRTKAALKIILGCFNDLTSFIIPIVSPDLRKVDMVAFLLRPISRKLSIVNGRVKKKKVAEEYVGQGQGGRYKFTSLTTSGLSCCI